MQHSYPTMQRLSFLLEMIQNCELALPDFQRDFVWDAKATEELIASVTANFPAGTLLSIKNGKELLFAPREIKNAPPLNGHKPAYLILDGQQRLTSLYQAFYGHGDYRYFIHLSELENGNDLEDCIFFDKVQRAKKRYGSISVQAEELILPLACLFGEGGGFAGWVYQVLKQRAKAAEEMLDLQARLSALEERWIRPIREYEFPMVTLNEETDGEAVCTIFETLNRTGIKLGVYDLLTARFWPKEVNLREWWEEARNQHPIIEDFQIDPYYALQALSLLEPGKDNNGQPKAPSCKKKDVLSMTVEQARNGWQHAIDGLGAVLKVLREDCGVVVPNWLPYNTVVIPMAAAWAGQHAPKGLEIGSNRKKLVRWFWCSILSQTYDKGANSQAAKDYGELVKWFEGGNEPETVRRFDFDYSQLRNVTPQQRAVYRGIICLILSNLARDFYEVKPIDAALITRERIDDHHIFPKAYLEKTGPFATKPDSVLNRSLIDKLTNISIGCRAPSDYWQEIETKLGPAGTSQLLSSHVLPTGKDSPLRTDAFEEFISWREKAISDLIRERTR